MLALSLLAGAVLAATALTDSANPANPALRQALDLPGSGIQAVAQPPGESNDAAALGVRVTIQPRFVWPARGRITSYFGPRHPAGIDIGLDAGEDDRIFATAGGIVTFAGGDPCCEFGLYVEIQHEGRYRSLYAHLDSIDVNEGDSVVAGQVIGIGGITGLTSGKHLHFELADALSHVDPMRLLPLSQDEQAAELAGSCPGAALPLDQASSALLQFEGDGLAGFEVAEATLKPAAEGNGAAPRLRSQGGLSLALEVPARLSGQGGAFDYALQATLARGRERLQAVCDLRLSFFTPPPDIETEGPTDAQVLRAARAAAAAAAAAAAGEVPPTVTPTPTITPRPRPTATPTSTPRPTWTPRPTSTAVVIATPVAPSVGGPPPAPTLGAPPPAATQPAFSTPTPRATATPRSILTPRPGGAR